MESNRKKKRGNKNRLSNESFNLETYLSILKRVWLDKTKTKSPTHTTPETLLSNECLA